MNILSLISLARSSSYNDEIKTEWKKKSMSFLRRVAKELNLIKGDYSIRFNPGGIAVSGDAILHHNQFYLHINDFGGYWRTCKGQKDYTGGPNNNFNTGSNWGRNLTESELIKQIRGVLPEVDAKQIDWEKVTPCCTKDD